MSPDVVKCKWDDFSQALLLLGYNSLDINDFYEHFMNLDTPQENLRRFQVMIRPINEVCSNIPTELKHLIASFVWGTGCGCCAASDIKERKDKLAELIGVSRYEDDSGYNWAKYLEEVQR